MYQMYDLNRTFVGYFVQKLMNLNPEQCPKKLPQIGNRFALTASHCLFDNNNEELLPVSLFSIMLGLHDRKKEKEPRR